VLSQLQVVTLVEAIKGGPVGRLFKEPSAASYAARSIIPADNDDVYRDMLELFLDNRTHPETCCREEAYAAKLWLRLSDDVNVDCWVIRKTRDDGTTSFDWCGFRDQRHALQAAHVLRDQYSQTHTKPGVDYWSYQRTVEWGTVGMGQLVTDFQAFTDRHGPARGLR
jgi:hypothetical protein